MQQIIPDVYMFEGLHSANVFVLRSDKGLMLVDSGWSFDLSPIIRQIQQGGFDLSDITDIVLTHWHGDHSGNAATLARQSGAQVLVHRLEAPYIEKSKPVPARTSLQPLLIWLSDHILLRRSACKVDRTLSDGDMIDVFGRLRVIHTPGHTPGSISLYDPKQQVLFCGDTIFNLHPLTGKRGLGLHMRALVYDMGEMRASVKRLADLPVRILCCGHGEPVMEGVNEKMKVLLEQ